MTDEPTQRQTCDPRPSRQSSGSGSNSLPAHRIDPDLHSLPVDVVSQGGELPNGTEDLVDDKA
eukprot:4829096-Pyramimonas_sp.AAC.1